MEQRNIKLVELKGQIEKALRGHVPQMSVSKETTQDDVYQCIRRVMRESPDIFWFSHQWNYTEDDQTIGFRYTISKDRSITARKQIEDVIQKVLSINMAPYGCDSKDIATAYSNIGLSLFYLGEFGKEKTNCEKSINNYNQTN